VRRGGRRLYVGGHTASRAPHSAIPFRRESKPGGVRQHCSFRSRAGVKRERRACGAHAAGIDTRPAFMVNNRSMSELVRPFKGLLYNGKYAADIAGKVCPPFDIIPDPRPYYDRDPLNAIRLELPLAAVGEDVYGTAKETLDAWLAEGVLCLDSRESVYIYEQAFTLGGKVRRRRGVIALVRLGPGRILTHEETRRAAREDRRRLIKRLGVLTSLVFSMYEDRSKEIERLIDAAPKELLYDFTDELSIGNKFYRVSDPAAIGTLASAMKDKKLYVADGHHRLSVALDLKLPYAAMYLTDMRGDGIAILPYHRTARLKAGMAADRVLDVLSPYFDIAPAEYAPGAVCERLIEGISSAPGLSFFLYFKGEKPGVFRLTQKKAIDFDPESHPALRALKVSVVHRGVLKRLLGVDDDAISYFNDADEAAGVVDAGAADLAVFVPATSVEEVKTIADNGLFMPPKSTYFYPKILTGLVFHRYV